MQLQRLSTTFTSRIRSITSIRPSTKQIGIVAGVGTALLILVNLALLWYYQDHYYANTRAGAVKVGGMSQSRAYQVLADRIDRQPFILSIQDKVVKIPTSDLGAMYDIDATIADLNRLPKPIIPMLFWLPGDSPTSVKLHYRIDQQKFDKKIGTILQENKSEPKDAELQIKDGSAKIIPHKTGINFNENEVVKAIKSGLGQLSDEPLPIPTIDIPVRITEQKLRPSLDKANRILKTKIALTYEDNVFTPSRSEIGSWLKLDDGVNLAVDEPEVAGYIEKISEDIDIASKNEVVTTLDGVETGREPGQAGRSLNRTETIKAVLDALNAAQDLDYQLKVETVDPATEYVRKFSFSAVRYSYCVQANSVSDSMLQYFSQKISATFADPRGWGLNGKISFVEVESGCNFTMVLAAANTLPGYSSVCSTYYSCRVGSSVIINVDRWTGASESWNQAGGPLDEYQTMVINHEVGHWLGFYDNQWVCQGPGQKAPLMQQQSIDLRGCLFNAWPTPVELQSLQAMKGV